MVRSFWLAAVALLGTAPYQCKSNDPERAREDSPGEALLQLCGRFADKGEDESAKRVLDYLIERYPSSREAERAKDERKEAHPCKGVTAETKSDAEAKAAKKPASSSSK